MLNIRRWVVVALLSGVVWFPGPAISQVSMTLSGSGEFQHNSNVFDLQPGYTLSGLPPGAAFDDNLHTYAGTYNLKYGWSQQTFYADAAASQVHYQNFTQLNHTEYRFDGGWDGMIGRAWDGNFDVLRTRSMVPFEYVLQSDLTVTTTQREQGGIGLQFLPKWRAEGSGYTYDTDWPLPGEPNLRLNESEGQLALKYLGTSGLTSGVASSYLTGHFSGAANPTTGVNTPTLNQPYRQWAVGLVTSYMSSRSTLTGQIGYSDRTSTGTQSVLNSVSGVTGALDYTNQLTGKTSITLGAARRLSTFITNSGSEIQNTIQVAINWHATYKILVSPSYSWDYAELPGQGNNPIGSERLDHVQSARLEITYQILHFLTLKPYVGTERRRSNLLGGNFNASMYGINLALSWQHGPEDIGVPATGTSARLP